MNGVATRLRWEVNNRSTLVQPKVLYLAYFGIHGERVRLLLWPAVGLHVVLKLLLEQSWFESQPGEPT